LIFLDEIRKSKESHGIGIVAPNADKNRHGQHLEMRKLIPTTKSWRTEKLGGVDETEFKTKRITMKKKRERERKRTAMCQSMNCGEQKSFRHSVSWIKHFFCPTPWHSTFTIWNHWLHVRNPKFGAFDMESFISHVWVTGIRGLDFVIGKRKELS
jgi:hypothetical protein